MKKHLSHLLVAGAIALVASPAAATDIEFRNFSPAAAMGPPADAYGAKLHALTTEVLGPSGAVRFYKIAGKLPPIPFGGDLIKAVGVGKAGGGFDAAYNSGSEINKAWGFLFNSGIPFGPGFDEYLGFLFGKSVDGTDAYGNPVRMSGVELLQSILDKNNANVVALPIVGNAEQVSGYFALPVGDAPDGTPGIGLVGFCQQPWRLRYLLPGENVLTQACDNLVAEGVIPARNISFVQAIPGGGSLVNAVKLGELEAFEFATALDDVSQLWQNADGSTAVDNPGTVGLRYAHFPGWQQQFLITWMLINKDVWNGLTPQQQALAKVMARENLVSSYGENMARQGPALKYILDSNRGDGIPGNDMQLVQWPKDDQTRMRAAAVQFLNGRATDAAFSAETRADYVTVLEALRKYVSSGDLYWDPRGVSPKTRFNDWMNGAGYLWTPKYKYEQ
jgi:hypothetical protein